VTFVLLYFHMVAIRLRSMMQYRATFWMMTLAQFFVYFFSFVTMTLLFDRFGSVAGWTVGEVALCFVITGVAFALAECVARGFDVFSRMVRSGAFDRVLLRPHGTILQVMGSEFELSRMGRLAQSVVTLFLANRWLGMAWTPGKLAVLSFMVLSGAVTFTGVFIAGAALSFVTIEGMEVVNIFTDGGREMCQYPLSVYPRAAARFFTCVIPFGCFNYLPLLWLTGRVPAAHWWFALSPLACVPFFLVCVWIWGRGVRRYQGTGN